MIVIFESIQQFIRRHFNEEAIKNINVIRRVFKVKLENIECVQNEEQFDRLKEVKSRAPLSDFNLDKLTEEQWKERRLRLKNSIKRRK